MNNLIDNSKTIWYNLDIYTKGSFEKTDGLLNLVKNFSKIINECEQKLYKSIKIFKILIDKDNFEQKGIYLNYNKFIDLLKNSFKLDFEKYKNIDTDFIEPFDKEIKKISEENKNYYNVIKNDLNLLVEWKKDLKLSSKNYYWDSNNYKNLEENFHQRFKKNNVENQNLEEEMKKISNLKINSEESKNMYKNNLDSLNNQLMEFLNNFKKNWNKINKNEDIRFGIVLNRTNQFIDFQKNKIFTPINEDTYKNSIKKNKFNLYKSLTFFSNCEVNFDNIKFKKFKSFDMYWFLNKLKSNNSLFVFSNNLKLKYNNISKQIQYFICSMLNLENYDDIIDLSNIINEFDNNLIFIIILYKFINEEIITIDYKYYTLLNKILTNIFKGLKLDNNDYFKILFIILRLSVKICFETESSKKIFLIENFNNNFHWKNFDLWLEIFNLLKGDNKSKNIIINKINSFWKNKNKKNDNDLFYSGLSKISKYLMILFKNVDLCKEILLWIFKKNKFGKDSYEPYIDNFEIEFLMNISDNSDNEKIKKYKNKFNENSYWRIVIDFISNDPKSMFKILTLNKKYYSLFKNIVCKEILILDYNDKYRYNLWKFMIDDYKNYNYEEILNNLKISENLEDIINMDVKRSYNDFEDFDNDGLKEILKASTMVLDKSLSYCQGMNYICGMLFFQLKDKNFIFNFYVNLIQNKMKNCFNDNFNNLKVHFDILDKLILYYLPEIGEYFNKWNIISIYFANSWFIIWFSNTYQYTKKSFLVEYIFDIFFRYGYYGMYKIILIILNYYKELILVLDFDGIMNFLSNIINREIFINKHYVKYKDDLKTKDDDFIKKNYISYLEEYEFIKNFKKNCNKLNVSKKLIKIIKSRLNK